MQGKLFQRCTHLLYCSVLSLSQRDMGSIFYIKNQSNILFKGNYYVNYQNLMLLSSSDTKLSILVYKFRTERTGFNMNATATQLQLTFLAL